MSEMNADAPAIVRRRRRIARQQRESTPEPVARIGGTKPKYSDDESSSTPDIEKRHGEPYISTSSPPSDSATGLAHHNSNVAYREKILSRRDRYRRTSPVVRSQSTPRQLQPDDAIVLSGSEEKAHSESGGRKVIRILRQAKRSLSIPRSGRDVACETSPVRTTDEAMKRYARTAAVQPVPAHASDADDRRELSKLELNLRRFEEERRHFVMEKDKFEREKRQMEQLRFHRLLEFEKKRAIQEQQRDREQLALEAAAIAIAEIEKQRALLLRRQRSRSRTRSIEQMLDDYESSTATTVSSRAGDFDGIDVAFDVPMQQIETASDTTDAASCAADAANEPKSPKLPNEAPPILPLDEHREGATIDDGAASPLIRTIDEPLAEPSFLRRLFHGTATASPITAHDRRSYLNVPVDDSQPISFKRIVFIESPLVWRQVVELHPAEWRCILLLRNRCIANFVILCMLFGLGGFIFRFIEGTFEHFYKCGVRRVKRDFVDHLWTSSRELSEDDWKSLARTKLRSFEEELHVAHEAGLTSYSGLKAWTFINSVVYSMTICTTIGYGHISPATNTGRAVTIIYAVIGIPIFLILLADFGKLFTRSIKFVWAFVRRLYYTGSLRRVRKQAQVQEVIRGMNIAYEIATFRRPSTAAKESDLEDAPAGAPNATHLGTTAHSTPTTPMPPEIEIDDEFNLPISLALFILIAYILCGAAVYSLWEEWSFFESCYFVFVSMSTIGFGDYVPKHPMRMMASIIYLIFGLSLTSMCINVVQAKLSDSFRQASAKIGATIGLSLAEEEARSSETITPIPENLSVHSYGHKHDGNDTNKAKDTNARDHKDAANGNTQRKPSPPKTTAKNDAKP